MKKIAKIMLVSIVIISSFSCGPRRYGCGPNRRCEVKEQPKMMLPQEKTVPCEA
jgi:hypothetical protein